MLPARPQHKEAAAKITTEMRKNRRRPIRSLSFPDREGERSWPTEYAVMTQLVQLIVECSPCSIACSAVATMVPSSELISKAIATTEKIATRCGACVTSEVAVTRAYLPTGSSSAGDLSSSAGDDATVAGE